MRALLQRVSFASVEIEGHIHGKIDYGLVLLIGVTHEDTIDDVGYLAEKIVNLRVFDDQNGKINLSTLDIDAEILVISQFTLYADCSRGRRPGFNHAAPPDHSEPLYQKMVSLLKENGIRVESGVFGAEMLVKIHNHGPVTIMLDSEDRR